MTLGKSQHFRPSWGKGDAKTAMTTVLLVIHVMIAAALVATVLLQRSEGGALGIGGGGGFMAGRGAANLLTRVTGILAAAFFASSIILTILANSSPAGRSILDKLNNKATISVPADPNAKPAAGGTPAVPAPVDAPAGGGLLDKLKGNSGSPSVPQPN